MKGCLMVLQIPVINQCPRNKCCNKIAQRIIRNGKRLCQLICFNEFEYGLSCPESGAQLP